MSHKMREIYKKNLTTPEIYSRCIDSHKDAFWGLSCCNKLGGTAYIFHARYGSTDMIMDPILVFMKNL